MKKNLMLTFLFVFIIIFVILFLHIFGPIKKTNEMLVYINKNNLDDIDFTNGSDNNFISEEDYVKLRVGNFLISEDEFVNIKTKTSISALSLSSITIDCAITANVESFEHDSKAKKYSAKKTIVMAFKNLKWNIVKVSDDR